MLTILLPLLLAAPPMEFTARVVSVSDGDTIRVVTHAKTIVVRLNGIDAPELHQSFGRESRARLMELVDGRDVRIVSTGTDRYGRTLATVFVGEVDINHAMVSSGAAWHFKQYAPKDAKLAAAEIDAREAHRGLWSGGDSDSIKPIPPWEWRAKRIAR